MMATLNAHPLPLIKSLRTTPCRPLHRCAFTDITPYLINRSKNPFCICRPLPPPFIAHLDTIILTRLLHAGTTFLIYPHWTPHQRSLSRLSKAYVLGSKTWICILPHRLTPNPHLTSCPFTLILWPILSCPTKSKVA